MRIEEKIEDLPVWKAYFKFKVHPKHPDLVTYCDPRFTVRGKDEKSVKKFIREICHVIGHIEVTGPLTKEEIKELNYSLNKSCRSRGMGRRSRIHKLRQERRIVE